MKQSLIEKIFEKIENDPCNVDLYRDAFDVCRNLNDHPTTKELRKMVSRKITEGIKVQEFFSVYKDILLYNAPIDFDSYLLYVEIDRDPKARFYQNRRSVLKQVVDGLQALADNELDELFVSMPPRIGKTTLLVFYMTWLLGRNSEAPSLYSSYSDLITKAFYNGVLEIIQDQDTYLYQDVFPKSKIVRTNAQDEILDMDRKKHYPSLTCRSLYGTLNGACDAENGIIISDDLIGGIEEALNKDRLDSAWSKVDNNLIPRGKGSTKYLWWGTRWSIADPTGRRLDLLMNDEKFKGYRYKMINLPALDENDESNFNYKNGVGFDTDYYHRRRASFERNNDMASWLAQYQGEPIERDGTLFRPTDLRYFNGQICDEIDRVIMAVDPAFGGGDFVAAPIGCQVGNDIYIVDVIFSNEDKRITQPLLSKAIRDYGVQAVQFECTKATMSYKEGVEDLLEEKVNLMTKSAATDKSKEQRIFDKSPEIRERMIFLEDGKRSKSYQLFMQNVFSFKVMGKNKHDDAPDSLAMMIDMAFSTGRRVEIFSRPF